MRDIFSIMAIELTESKKLVEKPTCFFHIFIKKSKKSNKIGRKW